MKDRSGTSTEEFDFSRNLEKISSFFKIFKDIKEKFVIKSEYRLFCYQIGSVIKSLPNRNQIALSNRYQIVLKSEP